MTSNDCIVKGCPSLHKLFTLPLNKNRRDVWLEMVQREDLAHRPYSCLKGYGVCAAHFPTIAFTDSSYKKLCRNAVPSGKCEESGQIEDEPTRPSTPAVSNIQHFFDTSPEMCNDKVLQHTKKTYGKIAAALKCAARPLTLEVPGTSQQSDNLEAVHTWGLSKQDPHDVIKKEEFTDEVTDQVDEQSMRIIRKAYLHDWIDDLDNEAFDRFMNNIQAAMREEDERNRLKITIKRKLDEPEYFPTTKR